MQDEHSARCILAQMPAISIWATVQLSRSNIIHELCSTDTTLVSSPCSGPGQIRKYALSRSPEAVENKSWEAPFMPWGAVRESEKPCRRSKDGHHASRKPSRYPDNGCISCGGSSQDEPAVVEQRQLDLVPEGADIGFGKYQLAGALPLLAHLPIL
jgi:hypothetical protein